MEKTTEKTFAQEMEEKVAEKKLMMVKASQAMMAKVTALEEIMDKSAQESAEKQREIGGIARIVVDCFLSQVKESYTITCRVRTARHFKKMSFFDVYDESIGAVHAQLVISDAIHTEVTPQSYLHLDVKVEPVKAGHTTTLGFELHCIKVHLVSIAASDFITRVPEEAGVEVQLAERHLWLRHQQSMKYLLIGHAVQQAIRDTFLAVGSKEIITPIFGSTLCEGGSSVFKFKHFDDDAYLTQSEQFYLEAAAAAIGSCFCIAPSFRMEKSRTRRHLSKFQHAEMEAIDIFGFDDLVKLLSEFLLGLLERVVAKCELYTDISHIKTLIAKGIRVLPHQEAVAELRKRGITKTDGSQFEERDDIPEAQERQLIDQLDQIIFLCKFPHEHKSFYAKADPADPSRTLTVDVEVPGVGEIIGSGVRVSDYQAAREGLMLQIFRDAAEIVFEDCSPERKTYWMSLIIEKKVPELARGLFGYIGYHGSLDEWVSGTCMISGTLVTQRQIDVSEKLMSLRTMDRDYGFYLDLRKYGHAQTAGFGLGIERLYHLGFRCTFD